MRGRPQAWCICTSYTCGPHITPSLSARSRAQEVLWSSVRQDVATPPRATLMRIPHTPRTHPLDVPPRRTLRTYPPDAPSGRTPQTHPPDVPHRRTLRTYRTDLPPGRTPQTHISGTADYWSSTVEYWSWVLGFAPAYQAGIWVSTPPPCYEEFGLAPL
eukprot:364382-Chlamydomonas_euryale.AAC.3